MEAAVVVAAAGLATGMLAVRARRDKVLRAVPVPLLVAVVVARPQSAQTLRLASPATAAMDWPRLLQDHRLRMLAAAVAGEVPVLRRQRAAQAAAARAVRAEYPVLQVRLTVAAAAAAAAALAAQTQGPRVVQAWLLFPHLLQPPQPQVRRQLQRLAAIPFINLTHLARLHSKGVQWHILQK